MQQFTRVNIFCKPIAINFLVERRNRHVPDGNEKTSPASVDSANVQDKWSCNKNN